MCPDKNSYRKGGRNVCSRMFVYVYIIRNIVVPLWLLWPFIISRTVLGSFRSDIFTESLLDML